MWRNVHVHTYPKEVRCTCKVQASTYGLGSELEGLTCAPRAEDDQIRDGLGLGYRGLGFRGLGFRV